MKAETSLSRNQAIQALARSEHGKLDAYAPMASQFVEQDPFFLAHLIAWNQKKGAIRDAKLALPVVSITSGAFEFAENSLANLALQSPRDLLRAARFAMERKHKGYGKAFRGMVESYLRVREDPKKFFRVAVQHRRSLHELYALFHIKPGQLAEDVLFKGKKIGVFKTIAELKEMPATNAASAILQNHIPFLVAINAAGEHKKNSDFLLALIEGMTPAEVVNNMSMLTKFGAKDVPALRAAIAAKLEDGKKAPKNALKAKRAAEATGDKQLIKTAAEHAETLRTIEGDWLVLGDKSGSMQVGIEAARQVASIIAASTKGKVWLVFFDTNPVGFDVTGKSLKEIEEITRGMQANGGTSIGCGLYWALQKKLNIDGVAVVSDGAENNSPIFRDVIGSFERAMGKEIPVYYYKVGSRIYMDTFETRMRERPTPIQKFDLSGMHIDYYSLPNLVHTMRPNVYSLADEILETPLLTLKEALHGL